VLTTAELTSMQAVQQQTMTETVVVSRRTLTSDSLGGRTDSWTTAATTVGRIAPVSAGEAILAGQQRIVANWKITLPANTDVRNEDRLTIGSRVFEVVGIQGAETRETARVCLCQER
jgi:SPP1 family predicted phage head-tail adaptor